MTVKTQMFNVGSDWIQVTDGTQTKSLQVHRGSIRLADADSNPGASFWMGHMVNESKNTWVTITPPTIAWMRVASADGATAEVSVS
ncbi:hypothetical protein ACTUSX_11370 [Pantoea ananatis]|uniref:hypothetical protein n=1 Tax=Pantoea ananas TaxID=553 RepID=UPI003FA46542